MEFTFEQSPWDLAVASLQNGDVLSALDCLDLLADLSAEEAEEALLLLEEKGVTLDISTLPHDPGAGETAVRLRYEQQWVQTGGMPEKLEENDPLRLCLEELAAIPVCGDVVALACRYAQGDDEIAPQLVNLCLSHVIELAFAMTGRGVLLMDLIQEGSLGLWQGILNYTVGDFEAHIRWWIRQYMHKLVFLQARSGDIGERMRQGMTDYRDADQQLLAQLGRNPTLEEIAEAIHVTVQEAETFRSMLEQARLRRQVDMAREPKEQTADDAQAVENTAYFQTRQRIAAMLSVLTEQEAKLLTLRFGLEGGMPQTPEQTGQTMGLTPDEVIQMETAALMKLRQQEE